MFDVLYFEKERKNQLAQIIYASKNFSFHLQDDEDGHLVVLTIIEELMNKRQEEFLDHFARLGVFSKVQSLMGGGSSGDSDSDVIRSLEEPTTSRGAVKGKI